MEWVCWPWPHSFGVVRGLTELFPSLGMTGAPERGALPVAGTVLRSPSHTEDRAMRTGSQPRALALCLHQAALTRVGLIAGSSSAGLSVCFPGEACPLASHYFGFHYSYAQEFSCSWGLEVKRLLVGLCALFKEHSPEPSLPSRERWPISELGNRLSQG